MLVEVCWKCVNFDAFELNLLRRVCHSLLKRVEVWGFRIYKFVYSWLGCSHAPFEKGRKARNHSRLTVASTGFNQHSIPEQLEKPRRQAVGHRRAGV